MKKLKRIAMVDTVILIILFVCMYVTNHASINGTAGISSVGWFVVFYLAFQISLLVLVVIGVIAFILKMKRRQKQ